MKKDFKNIALAGIWGLVLIGLLVFQVSLIFLQKTGPVFQVGDRMPDINLKSWDGQGYQLDELVKSKPVLLIFFASDSGPSRLQIGEIAEYLKRQTDAGFQAVLVSDDSRAKIEGFQKEMNLPLPILIDENSEAIKAYQVNVVPTSFLIDQKRLLLYYQAGSEGFSVYKIQALLKYGGGIKIEERQDPGKQEGTKSQ